MSSLRELSHGDGDGREWNGIGVLGHVVIGLRFVSLLLNILAVSVLWVFGLLILVLMLIGLLFLRTFRVLWVLLQVVLGLRVLSLKIILRIMFCRQTVPGLRIAGMIFIVLVPAA